MKDLKNKKIIFKKKDNLGFTLIESLIAITILMISVAAPLNLAGKGITAANIAQKQIVAFYLAQDATESLINIKMGNKLDMERLLTGMNNCKVTDFSDNNGCIIDTSNLIITSCGVACSLDGKMYMNATTGFYSHVSSSGDFSGFTRFSKIKIISVSNPGSIDQEAEIETIVKWRAVNGKQQEYKLNTHISNW